jgi:U1 small nuclear ribonucleoprotein
VVVRKLLRGRKVDRPVCDRHHRDREQGGGDEHRAPVGARPDRDRDGKQRQDAEPRGDRVRLDECDRRQRPVAVGERRLEGRDHERACDSEQGGSRQRDGEGAARCEQERAGGNAARGEPE